MSERSHLADLLRATPILQPEGDEGFAAIARLLGLRVAGLERPAETRSRPKPRDVVEPEESSAPAVPAVAESKPRRRIGSVLTPAKAGRNPAPHWLVSAHFLETTAAAHIRPAIPLEPLFPTRTSRTILSGALATPSATGPLDLTKVIDLLSRARAVREIPRLSVPTLVRGVQLLIDCSESMQPFAADQADLRAALASVVGRDRTEVLYFENTPLRGEGTGPRDEWPDYRTPARGTPVVVLTDLGIMLPPGVAGTAGVSDWRALRETLAHAGCPLVALVPYPPRRWPPALSRLMTIIQWDRATTSSMIRRLVPAGSHAARGF